MFWELTKYCTLTGTTYGQICTTHVQYILSFRYCIYLSKIICLSFSKHFILKFQQFLKFFVCQIYFTIFIFFYFPTFWIILFQDLSILYSNTGSPVTGICRGWRFITTQSPQLTVYVRGGIITTLVPQLLVYMRSGIL